MSKGILQVHPPICDCPGCRISSPVNRGRLAEKRTIPLPPTRIPKKELTSIFSHSDDSEESDKGNGLHPEVKQEEDLHISIMKRRIHTHWDLNISFRETSCSRDNDLSTIISNLHQSRQLVMPETQSRCEFKRNSIDVGLGAADEILGKRRVCSPNSSSECPLESKKARSESPKENSHTPLLEDAVTQMTPEEHYRRMMSALNEHGTFEEQQQQQRLYQLANSMAVPGHGVYLRARMEAAGGGAARRGGAMEAHIPAAGNSSSQRRKQGLPQHRDSHFPDREISHPPPLLSPQNAPHIALGPHLRPPFLGVPSALCQTPGYGFLQPAQAEMFARQQEMLRKQNLARLEMSAEIIRQKELENLHRQRLLATPSHLLGAGLNKAEVKYLPPAALPPPQPLPFGFPYTVSPYFHAGTMGGLFLDGEESPALEDISKWTVEDVCSFVANLAGCTEFFPGFPFLQVFREQAIDGETLPLLTEEHLLNNMGLKLGPALKIRSQVAKRVGRVLYMAGFPMAFPQQQPGWSCTFCCGAPTGT
ncbi:PREDICTED: sterile alpha motif domain-containing protein 11 [Tinamus guttatus]|uniref:sterile alpha motif domain-containing protein 11 n=1 Tax=Tinamus guttatus TaxID=94827 RepID=UPI00052F1C91|nr:PREDICTED: sterile alpha motif domain-containing protein 11 [Tinamus guttatus]